MTKKIKLTLIGFLTALIMLGAIFVLFPGNSKPVKAAEATGHENHALTDSNFAWSSGAQASIDAYTGENCLRFTFKLKNTALNNLLEYAPPVWGGMFNSKDYFYLNYYINEFKLYRLNANGEAISPISILIGYDYCKEDGDYILNYTYAVKTLSYATQESLAFNPVQLGTGRTNNGRMNDDLADYIEKNGYSIVCSQLVTDSTHIGNDYGLTWKTNAETLESEMTIDFVTYSPYTTYFMEFNYYYYYPVSGTVTGTNDEEISGTLDSVARSVSYILNAMNDDGVLEDYCEDEDTYNYAMDIITEGAKKDVKISYLEKIENSSFAKKITKTVSVPVYQNELSLDDIYSVLNVETLDVLDSQLYEFRCNEEGTVYNAYYLEDIWLRSITTDGNYLDYFLDINLSYAQTYMQFVDAGIISQEMYEYIFAKMIEANPGATGYKFDEVYGYFGLVAVPTTYTFNTLWVEMFDVKTSTSGLLENFSFDLNLSHSNYMKLLDDYQYGWLDKAWNTVTGFVAGSEWPATFYLFYSEPGTQGAYVGEGGQTDPEDPDGAIDDGVDEIIPDIIDGLKPEINIGTTALVITGVILAVVIIMAMKNKKKKNKKEKRK